MGETIDFPGPNERLRLAAEKAYQSKEFLQAFRLYNELYQKMPVLRSINGSWNACNS